ncbi:M16 family metallopeptidase [Plastoroseomonas arctica]|uniref:Insulinase family protein n=1 Tax=Plastoroseomonas arctica TaxID=1509237 RepID=A0AAF1JZ87_9PROT|nr:pitrilysin family protein [Plastoroseomonas arctica]MBR0656515.1 insulinase family protein [Plastoroseomonas arctica]
MTGFSLPIQVIDLPGGKIWLVEDHSVPVVSLSWSWRGGAAPEPPGQEGATSLMAAMLGEGAGDLPARNFADALRDDAINLGFDGQRDGFEGSLRALRDALPAALRLARLAMVEPRFDNDAFERVRARALAGARQSLETPRGQASRAFWAGAYPTHSAGRPTGGTPESIAALTIPLLREAHDRQLRATGMLIGVSGAIDAASLRSMIPALFAGLPEGAPAEGPELPAFEHFPRRVVPMAFPQSTILFGQPGLAVDDPDWEAAQIMLRILGGGGFSSRLMQAVRVERGLTYGVSAGLDVLFGQAIISGGLATENGKVGEALDVIQAEWRRMSETGPTEAERDDAIAYLTGSQPLQFTDSRRISSTLLALQRNNRPLDWLSARPDRLNAISNAQLAALSKRMLKPDGLAVVVAGQPTGL